MKGRLSRRDVETVTRVLDTDGRFDALVLIHPEYGHSVLIRWLVKGRTAMVFEWDLAPMPWIGIGLRLIVAGLAGGACFGVLLDVVEPIGWWRVPGYEMRGHAERRGSADRHKERDPSPSPVPRRCWLGRLLGPAHADAARRSDRLPGSSDPLRHEPGRRLICPGAHRP